MLGLISRARLRAACLLVIAGLLGTVSVAPAAAQARHHSRHHVHHPSAHRHAHRGIPQHNGGDRDSDNNGHPSDGDGDV